MKTPTKTFNTLASVVGLILTAGTVFISASSASASLDAPVALATPTPVTSTTTDASADTGTTTATAPVTKPADTGGQPAAGGTTTPSNTEVATNTSGYADGSYTATIGYRTPGSIEGIRVTLTLKDGVITQAAIAQSGGDPESRRYQNAFASSYTSSVVGKSISSLSLSRVSGASLTTRGFDAALAQIKSEAAA